MKRFLQTSVLATVAFVGLAFCRSAYAEAVVAADGSGQFTSVQEAINAAPQETSATNRWTIRVRPGTYKELIYVQREKRFVQLVGDDPEKTILTYNLHAKMPGLDGKEIGTFRTATATVDADDFTVENLTIENTAGPVAQALAVRVDGDRVTFRNCRFLGWQDTLLANRGRHYFERCTIAGHVDFIFGGATAWFEKCHLRCLKDGYVTAASTPDHQPFGFVFSNCRITGDAPETKTFLGRPWRASASTFFLNAEMSDNVRPAGWQNWGKPEREKTVRYGQFNATGPGARAGERVPWSTQLGESEAKTITVERVLGGPDFWKPPGKVPPAPSVAKSSTPPAPMNATFTPDLEYGRVLGEKLLLDACVPEGDGPFPVAIMVHGGGWTDGDKRRDHRPVLGALTAGRFTWFAINYRLAPTHRWPACLEDVQTAIRWVKAHAAEFKGDPTRIAILGYSAGGQLVCHAAVLADDATRVQAVVGFAPPTDMVNDGERRGGLSSHVQMLLNRPQPIDEATRVLLREISPVNHLKPGLPPFLLIHGTEDKTVLLSQSENFRARLRAASVPCELIALAGAGHGLEEWDKFDATYREKLVAWLRETLHAPEPVR